MLRSKILMQQSVFKPLVKIKVQHIILFLISSILLWMYLVFNKSIDLQSVTHFFTGTDFWIFVLVGFLAQMIDGALGMAYGVSSTSFLLSVGVPPAVASANVHLAEVFTTGASGLAHIKFKNVNKKLFRYLVLPGCLGAAAGAYLLSSFDGAVFKPFVAAYLLLMGIVILRKALKKNIVRKKVKKLGLLAFTGGLLDALGGGGWGPVVTSSLMSRGKNARYIVGSVNLAEFFIALTGAATFILLLQQNNWAVVPGLVIGGVLAAPLSAYICAYIKPKKLMMIVGLLVIFLSIRTIYLSF